MSLTTTIADSPTAQSNGRAVPGDALTLHKKISPLSKATDLTAVGDEGWTHWRKHLSRRKSLRPLAKLTGTDAYDALLWALSTDVVSAETTDLLNQLAVIGKPKPKVQAADLNMVADAWLAERAERDADVALAIECLAWAHALPKLVATVDRSQWCDLLRSLLRIATDAAALDVDHSPLLNQLLAGELAFTLGCRLPEINACRSLLKSGKAALTEGVRSQLDGEGQLAGQHLGDARALLACWTRTMAISKAAEARCFNDEAAMLYEWFVRQSLGMMRADGNQMLRNHDPGDWNESLFTTAVKQAGDKTDRKLAKLVLPRSKSRSAKGETKTPTRLPPAATSSEWATTALLRTSWQPASPRLMIDYSRDTMRTELFVDKHVIWSGDCSPVITINGDTLAVTTAWHEVCWHSDEDADYIELEAEFTGGWKVQRQFLLGHEDRILLASDAILGPQSATIEYQCHWPVDRGLAVASEQETTECAIASGKKNLVRALPLALPEWKCDGRRAGTLGEADGAMRYSLRTDGQRLYAPLWLDLDRARMKYDYTWRQLSVGHSLQAMPADEAVGFRVQLRLDQFLIYRSLAEQTSRTVLGQNYFHEFVCGRFDRFGDVEPLVEVE